jgi:hypothetical protein
MSLPASNEDLRLVLWDGERPHDVELPGNCGLLMHEREGGEMYVLVAMSISLDTRGPVDTWQPIPVRLHEGQWLSVFDGRRLAAQFTGHHGIAVDPMLLQSTKGWQAWR